MDRLLKHERLCGSTKRFLGDCERGEKSRSWLKEVCVCKVRGCGGASVQWMLVEKPAESL